MKTIYVLGYKGMLGRYVYLYLRKKNFNVVGLSRSDLDAEAVTESTLSIFLPNVKSGDVIINCIGMIKPQVDKLGTKSAIKVNSLFPHIMNDFCKNRGINFLHITTDCVFSGTTGDYSESSPHDCNDIYGKTKSLGEFSEYGTIIRTSIIGEELENKRSLIEWIKSMKDKSANGFTDHWWNGLTCLQVAKLFEFIIVNDLYWNGVRHFFSPEKINKYKLLMLVSDIYDLNITITPVKSSLSCDRTMTTNIIDTIFKIPTLSEQISEQKSFTLI